MYKPPFVDLQSHGSWSWKPEGQLQKEYGTSEWMILDLEFRIAKSALKRSSSEKE